MNSVYLLAFIAEIWGVMFLVWGAFHQDRFVRAEQRIAETVRKVVRRK